MSDFDNILKNKLENFREVPSADVFNKIRENYPKRSFIDFIKYNKYYFIAVITALVLTGILISVIDKKHENEKSLVANKITDNTNNSVISNNNSSDNDLQDLSENKYYDKIVLSENSEKKNLMTEVEYENIKIFLSSDTIICGTKFETNITGSLEFLVVPDDICISKHNNLTVFDCKKPGNYIIRYERKSDNKILRDSMFVTYRNNGMVDVNLSQTILCPGEDLIVSLKNNSLIPEWRNNEYNISTISANKYEISGLKQGINYVVFELYDGECRYKYEKSVEVISTMKYKLVSTPSICSKSNATLTILSENIVASAYTLNNEYSNSVGVFKNLDPGIYSLTIKYGNECKIYDTLLIRDSLNISPYFIAERDLLNKNKYSFRNLTKLDDKGFERNNNISFIWKINGTEIINGDNPVYEFTKEGDNTVELIALIDESCQSVYSETIFVSMSNFRIPNIFTPNGDGIGDEFKVVYEGEIKNYKMTIMSRMGEIAFESNSISDSWDGKINGNNDAAEGLYYYIIRGEDSFGKIIEQKGALQLVRH
ncbi:MAG: gliding motility-associated C-terminal domain-containing protein [Bacteroidales bacterium]|nr:gliding motility-associated C-terminal domain-containing protein [Bacteroidales bacterium]